MTLSLTRQPITDKKGYQIIAVSLCIACGFSVLSNFKHHRRIYGLIPQVEGTRVHKKGVIFQFLAVGFVNVPKNMNFRPDFIHREGKFFTTHNFTALGAI
jgi:hypothetical protein